MLLSLKSREQSWNIHVLFSHVLCLLFFFCTRACVLLHSVKYSLKLAWNKQLVHTVRRRYEVRYISFTQRDKKPVVASELANTAFLSFDDHHSSSSRRFRFSNTCFSALYSRWFEAHSKCLVVRLLSFSKPCWLNIQMQEFGNMHS